MDSSWELWAVAWNLMAIAWKLHELQTVPENYGQYLRIMGSNRGLSIITSGNLGNSRQYMGIMDSI